MMWTKLGKLKESKRGKKEASFFFQTGFYRKIWFLLGCKSKLDV